MSERVATEDIIRENLPALVRAISVTQAISRTAVEEGQPAIAAASDEWVALIHAIIANCGMVEEYRAVARALATELDIPFAGDRLSPDA